ncbi:hypothetical protein [Hymenobacter amundsenii]|uniref:hypothetical protein n=1 Tax=Hymenobacter amundsenii TaxID=2006685 RepID=UPI000F83CAFA|nr:hypothetical protein [Hymenobacter amundsenii]
MSLKFFGISLLGFISFVTWFMISKTVDSRAHIKQSQKNFLALSVNQVSAIELYPLPDPMSLIRDPIIIRDTTAIRKLVKSYKSMSGYRAGDGRLPGDWQVMVNFKLKDGSEIISRVYHNNYADLVFVQTLDRAADNGSLDDYFANPSRDISKIIESYK